MDIAFKPTRTHRRIKKAVVDDQIKPVVSSLQIVPGVKQAKKYFLPRITWYHIEIATILLLIFALIGFFIMRFVFGYIL